MAVEISTIWLSFKFNFSNLSKVTNARLSEMRWNNRENNKKEKEKKSDLKNIFSKRRDECEKEMLRKTLSEDVGKREQLVAGDSEGGQAGELELNLAEGLFREVIVIEVELPQLGELCQ
jgi:hypothetical protein